MALERHLVLNRFFHHLLGAERFDAFKRSLQDCREGADSDGQSHFFHALSGRAGLQVPVEGLAGHDRRILAYEAELARNRRADVFRSFKYFQYLAVLYTELLLDRLTTDPKALLADLNRFKKGSTDFANLPDFEPDELRRTAFFMATGSGKTLLMHVNVRQVLHYLATGNHSEALVRRSDGRREFDSILLITPGEGLSDQHLRDLQDSGLDAARFIEDRSPAGLFGTKVKVIEIHKLAEEASGDGVSVPLAELGDRNLILVDEGRKGTGSEARTWKTRQQTLSRNGFLLEYSATFAQAIGSVARSVRQDLMAEYGKAILFDYSYRHFYADGYGKTFRVLNLKRGRAQQAHELILGGLLVFYQQVRLHESQADALRPYNVEKPLWVLLGTSVSRAKGDKSAAAKQERTDVAEVLAFLKHFLEDDAWAIERIEKTLAGESGFADDETGSDLFQPHLKHLAGQSAVSLYKRICKDLFHGRGALEVWDIKNGGEIGVRVSSGGHKDLPYFAVINIGDVPDFLDHVEQTVKLPVKEDRFTGSLFDEISRATSPIYMLVGAKKFIEGWSSWRVSSMGLLNVGKGEGSQVIQLFGRGVRLKGKDMSLKRSSTTVASAAPDGLLNLETLYIFGWNADYLQIFREMIEREELSKELPLLKVEHMRRWPDWLYVPERPSGCDWKEETWVLDGTGPNISLDLRPQVATVSGDGGRPTMAAGLAGQTVAVSFAKPPYSDLIDFDRVYSDLLEYKALHGLEHVFVPRPAVRSVLENRCDVQMLKEDAVDPVQLETAARQALRSYLERFARQKEREYDGEHAVPGFVDRETQVVREYSVIVYGTDSGSQLLKDIEQILQRPLKDLLKTYDEQLPRLYLDWHLFNPILIQGATDEWKEKVFVSPPALGPSEQQLVRDLKDFWAKNHQQARFKNVDVCLLRNLPKVGIGLFHGSGFYPDFILWTRNRATKEVKVLFLDPHGLHHGGLKANEDRFLAVEKLGALGDTVAFKKRKIRLAGSILAPASTQLKSIPDAGKLTWDDIERMHPVLRQLVPYVERLMGY